MAKHIPSSTDQVGNVDTTGIAPGPHSKLEGVTPVFDIDKERNAGSSDPLEVKSLEDRFAEKAVAAGTEEYQERNSDGETGEGVRVEQDHTSDVPYAPAVESPDTTGTDEFSASGRDHEEVVGHQTDTVDTSNTGGEPTIEPTSDTNVLDASSLTNDGASHTATASQERTDEAPASETAPTPLGGNEERRAGLNALKVKDLNRLAEQNGVEPVAADPERGVVKADLVAALDAAGVDAPADGVQAPSGADDDAAASTQS